MSVTRPVAGALRVPLPALKRGPCQLRRRHAERAGCLGCILLLGLFAARADEWPQWRGPNRDGVWQETGLIERFPEPQIKLRWRAPIGAGYSGPTVADGRVYVQDRVAQPKQIERVHCFDWQTGKPLWSHEYDCEYSIGYRAGPRASVSIDGGRAYALGAMGHFFCFDAATGNVLWQKDLNATYGIRMPIWGLAASPLVEADLVIVQIGGRGACLVAFDKQTGQERWKALDDDASYCAPIVIQQAGRRVLLCLTGRHVVGLDPASGVVHWRQPFPPNRMVISIATPVVDNHHVFVTSFYDGAMMLRLASDKLEAEKLWKRAGFDERNTDALHSIISTPLLIGPYIYGVDSYGELRCLEAATGERVWQDDTATPHARWSTIHMVRNGQRVWMFNERGELIIGRLSPKGFEEISRAKLIEPTTVQLPAQRGREGVCWSHPAYAYKHVFARNDNELVCASLAAE